MTITIGRTYDNDEVGMGIIYMQSYEELWVHLLFWRITIAW